MKLDIPVPRISDVASYEKDVPATYDVPRSYIRYCKPLAEEVMVDYNIDLEDETWLENHPRFGTKLNEGKDISGIHLKESNSTDVDSVDEDGHCDSGIRPTLPLSTFEHMIDLLEKATEFETIITLSQAERLILGKIPSLLQIFKTSGGGGPNINNFERKRKINPTNVRAVINDVYNYWVQKRSKLKKPLLRKYWPITASNDTNPHLVFRPREKEKYKLRKKRQNDYDAYKKMRQLRNDFAKVRVLLELIWKREELNKCILDMKCEWFDQRIYDMVDTSGLPKQSDRLDHDEIERALDIPKYFDTASSDHGKKRKRKKTQIIKGQVIPMTIPGNAENDAVFDTEVECSTAPEEPTRVVADQEHPPLFLHPLETRESYVTSWDHAVPFVTSYVDSHPTPTFRYRHRPRIGRGGRVIIDRLPHPGNPDIPPVNVFISGDAARLHGPSDPHSRLLDLLPEPIDYLKLSRRIEEIAADALNDDDNNMNKHKRARLPMSTDANTEDENDGEEILVKMSEWIETDEQLWGEELCYPIGSV